MTARQSRSFVRSFCFLAHDPRIVSSFSRQRFHRDANCRARGLERNIRIAAAKPPTFALHVGKSALKGARLKLWRRLAASSKYRMRNSGNTFLFPSLEMEMRAENEKVRRWTKRWRGHAF